VRDDDQGKSKNGDGNWFHVIALGVFPVFHFSSFAYYCVASRGLRSVLVYYPLNEIRAYLSAVAKKKNGDRQKIEDNFCLF
jgi:hypothetical protein